MLQFYHERYPATLILLEQRWRKKELIGLERAGVRKMISVYRTPPFPQELIPFSYHRLYEGRRESEIMDRHVMLICKVHTDH